MPNSNVKFLRTLFRKSATELRQDDLEKAYFILLESPQLLKAALSPAAIFADDGYRAVNSIDDETAATITMPPAYSPNYHRLSSLILVMALVMWYFFDEAESTFELTVPRFVVGWAVWQFLDCIHDLYVYNQSVKAVLKLQSQQVSKPINREDLATIGLDTFVEILRTLSRSKEDIGVLAKSFLILLASYPAALSCVTLTSNEKNNLRQDIECATKDTSASPLVLTLLATVYHYFCNDPSLTKAAFTLYQKASMKNIPDQQLKGFIPAKYLLIRLTLRHCAWSNESFSILDKIAREPYENAFAQALLGDYYYQVHKENISSTRGSEARKEALMWYTKAASQFHPHTLCRLGILSEETVDKLRYFFAAAMQGNSDAQYRLGLYYTEGAPPRNVNKAIQWLSVAAEYGHGNAVAELQRLRANHPDAPLGTSSALAVDASSSSRTTSEPKLSTFPKAFLLSGGEQRQAGNSLLSTVSDSSLSATASSTSVPSSVASTESTKSVGLLDAAASPPVPPSSIVFSP